MSDNPPVQRPDPSDPGPPQPGPAPQRGYSAEPGRPPRLGYPPEPAFQQPGYPYQPYGAPLPVRRQDPLPLVPSEYQHLLRGPNRRWWRPVLSALLLGAFASIAIVVGVVLLFVIALVTGQPTPDQWVYDVLDVTRMGPLAFAFTLYSLIVLIPSAMLAVRIVHGVPARFLSSVVGGIRWPWLVRCVLLTLPIWIVYLAISFLIEPSTSPRPQYWWLLLIMAVLFVPFQAAGEEYAFRGWVLQNVGAWFGNRVLSLVVPLVISVVVFAIAHGSTDIWVLADLGFFALVATVLTWQTGGLEAGIALHAVNNVTLFIVVLIFGGWEQSFVSGATTSTPVAFVTTAGVETVAAALILWQARRNNIQPRYVPGHRS